MVNGVEMPFGEAPPGAKGVLAIGQVLKLAEYSLALKVQSAAGEETDPWAVFDLKAVAGSSAAKTPAPRAAAPAEDDPFGDWGFQTTFGGTTPGTALDASKLGAAADLAPFFQGLGLDPATIGQVSQGELEVIGKLVRMAIEGLIELRAAAIGNSETRPNDELAALAVKDNNPLKTGWTNARKFQYLFGGRAASVGFVSPERAVRDLVAELLAHDLASGAAMREALEEALREFSPATLKERLLGGGTKLFEGARAWDAYSRYYAQEGRAVPEWAQRLLDKHFREAYMRESQRIKRETAERAPHSDGGAES
ncbi:type VI secretion system-associated FHA domain protein [uncultured Ramlibacter sp.]|uniref:type VI secretion system-associated FHA domain protein n=1 Tax=uncultured Ramlibacter sp. TaxID=260755 RepID=UPI00345C305C